MVAELKFPALALSGPTIFVHRDADDLMHMRRGGTHKRLFLATSV